MDEARKRNLSKKQKKLWEDIRALAPHLGVSPQCLQRFYGDISEADRELILEGDDAAIARVLRLPSCKRAVEYCRELVKSQNTDMELLGMAFWFIRQAGSPERAEKVLHAAAAAAKELKK